MADQSLVGKVAFIPYFTMTYTDSKDGTYWCHSEDDELLQKPVTGKIIKIFDAKYKYGYSSGNVTLIEIENNPDVYFNVEDVLNYPSASNSSIKFVADGTDRFFPVATNSLDIALGNGTYVQIGAGVHIPTGTTIYGIFSIRPVGATGDGNGKWERAKSSGVTTRDMTGIIYGMYRDQYIVKIPSTGHQNDAFWLQNQGQYDVGTFWEDPDDSFLGDTFIRIYKSYVTPITG